MATVKGAAEAEKIAQERRVLEAARQRSAYFPSGELVRDEPPDWLIPSASLGIELSDLLPAKPEGALFLGPQLSSFQEAVVSAAEERYCSSGDAPSVDVLVGFRNDWNRKRDVQEIAQALASFVLSNYPSGAKKSVTLEPMSDESDDLDGVSTVRILRGESAWHASGCTWIECLTYEQVAERIAAKDLLLPAYRKRWPGWEMWLLLSTRMRVLHSVSIPREVTAWRFNSDFDKVLLPSWDDGVMELYCVRSSA